jgi:NCS1 family nucleobase:cation symporter-1
MTISWLKLSTWELELESTAFATDNRWSNHDMDPTPLRFRTWRRAYYPLLLFLNTSDQYYLVHGVMFVTEASCWTVRINTNVFQVSYWFSDASNIAVWEASPKIMR